MSSPSSVLLVVCSFLLVCSRTFAAEITLPVGGVLNTIPFNPSYSAAQEWEMRYFENAVREMGGIPLRNGDRVFFDLQLEKVNVFDVANLTSITQTQCARGVRAFLGPVLAEDALVQANVLLNCVSDPNEVIILQVSANANSLFACPDEGWDQPEFYPCSGPGSRRFSSLWSVLPSIEDHVKSLINPFLGSTVEKIGIISLQIVGQIDSVEVVRRIAADNDIEVAPVEFFSLDGQDLNASLSVMVSALSRLRAEDPDVLISLTGLCDTAAAVEQMGWAPRGFAESDCVPILSASSDGRYIVSNLNWDSRLRGTSYVEDPNVIPSFFYDGDRPAPAVFLERMLEFSSGAYPAQADVAPMTALLALANAIWRAGSIDLPTVNQFMAETSMTGIWGQVQFGPRGKMTGR
eukprot:CAMPEP_0174237010 /NCGR_PEP_ID=MMETSP0417-20130205/6430_1 /TAXON_ID=242541 /ORGANISM="Mayorella sp, Strain BSH-02190019" /LENGTH=405 /DNA_ID=CAMNT_0015315719 /DNA_START=100 /DNA_END=1314 /DNA_ORIENTATION=-